MLRDYYSIELVRDELNRYFGGGIPKDSMILFEGIDGSGKSILCQRFAYAFLKKKIKVSYISTELNTLDFIKQMSSINYDIKEFMLSGQIIFLTMVPFFAKVKFETDFLNKIMTSKKIFESEIIIIDTLSFLLIKKEDNESVYYNIINFFRKLNNLNKTIIFTIDPNHLDTKFLTLLRSVSDLYIEIELSKLAGETIRNMNIKRFKRPMNLYTQKISYRVEPREGLVI